MSSRHSTLSEMDCNQRDSKCLIKKDLDVICSTILWVCPSFPMYLQLKTHYNIILFTVGFPLQSVQLSSSCPLCRFESCVRATPTPMIEHSNQNLWKTLSKLFFQCCRCVPEHSVLLGHLLVDRGSNGCNLNTCFWGWCRRLVYSA
jgi:hypothetical protein